MDGEDRDEPALNRLSYEVIGAAIRVHQELGPGLLESAYQECLAHVLNETGLEVAKEVSVPARFEGVQLEARYRIDLMVEERLVIELKVCGEVRPVHLAQLRTYLQVTGCKVGLLLNFHVPQMVKGVHRIVA